MNGTTITTTEQQLHHQLAQHSHLSAASVAAASATVAAHHPSQTPQSAQTLLTSGQAQQHLYDYYKLPLMVDGTTKAITLVTPDGKSVVAAPDGTLQEMVWR